MTGNSNRRTVRTPTRSAAKCLQTSSEQTCNYTWSACKLFARFSVHTIQFLHVYFCPVWTEHNTESPMLRSINRRTESHFPGTSAFELLSTSFQPLEKYGDRKLIFSTRIQQCLRTARRVFANPGQISSRTALGYKSFHLNYIRRGNQVVEFLLRAHAMIILLRFRWITSETLSIARPCGSFD